MHFPAGGKQVDDFIVETLVQVVPIGMLQLADRVHVAQRADFIGQSPDFGLQCIHGIGAHRGLLRFALGTILAPKPT